MERNEFYFIPEEIKDLVDSIPMYGETTLRYYGDTLNKKTKTCYVSLQDGNVYDGNDVEEKENSIIKTSGCRWNGRYADEEVTGIFMFRNQDSYYTVTLKIKNVTAHQVSEELIVNEDLNPVINGLSDKDDKAICRINVDYKIARVIELTKDYDVKIYYRDKRIKDSCQIYNDNTYISTMCTDRDEYYLSNSNSLFPDHYWSSDSCKFYTRPVMKADLKKQELVDELSSYLGEVDYSEVSATHQNFNRYYPFVIISRVNDEWACVRSFYHGNEKNSELQRIFVSKNEIMAAFKNVNNEWCFKKKTKLYAAAGRIYGMTPENCKGTKLEYYIPLFGEEGTLAKTETGEFNPEAVFILNQCLVSPYFEKVFKSGAGWCYDIYKASYKNCKFETFLEKYFGELDFETKNLNKCFGFNKYQLQKLSEHTNEYKCYGPLLKSVFNTQNVSEIDNDTFDAVLNGLRICRDSYYYQHNNLSIVETLQSVYMALPEEKLKALVLKVCRETTHTDFQKAVSISTYHEGDFKSETRVYGDLSRMYIDFLNMVNQLDLQNEVDPYFSCEEDIVFMHNRLQDEVNARKDKIAQKAFNNRIEIWKKWTYANDEFAVIAPENSKDIAVEGCQLHHCVGSYIDRVSSGKTNILFIRKVGEESTPFFTVEVSNKGNIVQVHGLFNRNVDTEPGLDKFIEEWAKSVKLKRQGINRVLVPGAVA